MLASTLSLSLSFSLVFFFSSVSSIFSIFFLTTLFFFFFFSTLFFCFHYSFIFFFITFPASSSFFFSSSFLCDSLLSSLFLYMASSRPFSLFPELNGPSSSSGPSAPALTQPSLPTLSVEQVMAAQNDIEANHYTLRSCMETVAAVTNLSHRLQSKACEVHQLNAQLSLLQCMYRDARAEICALKAENKELKAENKELKRHSTSMARFGGSSYLSFDSRRGADSLGGNTVVVLGGSTGEGPSKIDDKKSDKKRKSSATEEPSK